MGLNENFRNKISKIKTRGIDYTASYDVQYSTGFLNIDYLNGTVVHVRSEERSFNYNSIGIVDGSTNTVIGRSGSGKSTLITQMAGNILKPFIKKKMSTGLYIDDIEGSLPQSRKEFLLGMNQEQIAEYVDIRNYGITTENVFQRLQALHDVKLENIKEYEYDTGLFDGEGNRIYKLVPTVYIIDSLPMLMPEDIADKDELSGSMAASSIAKSNTGLFKRITQLCKEANIILFTVNHILDEIQMGFIPKAAQISGLKQGERLPGGRAALYLANNMFRVDDSITLKADKDFGIDGSIVNVTLIKSRTNATKRSVPMIFNKTDGCFDNILSLFVLLKNEGRVQGAGAYSYFNGCDVKFSQKNFKQKLEESPELREAFSKECYDVLTTLLSDNPIRGVEDSSLEDDILNSISKMGIED